jgi:hypothetical protein
MFEAAHGVDGIRRETGVDNGDAQYTTAVTVECSVIHRPETTGACRPRGRA